MTRVRSDLSKPKRIGVARTAPAGSQAELAFEGPAVALIAPPRSTPAVLSRPLPLARKENTMAEITLYPFLRHLRAEPSQHILRYRRGRLVSSGRGQSFWFRPLDAAIAAVPGEDLEVPFLFQGRSRDFQEVNVQGVVTYRVADPERLAQRVDFSIDLRSGVYRHKPLERIAGAITELAQQMATDYLAAGELQKLLAGGGEELRRRIDAGLRADPGLAETGIEVVSVRVSSVTPSPEVEKALRVPVRESIQQSADEATFRRRAEAVQKERAIQENELQNKIELSKREEQLIEQKGANDRRRVTDESEAARIVAEGQAARSELESRSRAAGIRAVEEAKVVAERERMLIYRQFPPEQLMALAVQELAGKLNNVEQITITPDHIGSLLKQLGLALPAAPVVTAAKEG